MLFLFRNTFFCLYLGLPVSVSFVSFSSIFLFIVSNDLFIYLSFILCERVVYVSVSVLCV